MRRPALVEVVFVILLVLPAGISAQSKSFSGRVVDSSSGEPVAGAIVTLAGLPGTVKTGQGFQCCVPRKGCIVRRMPRMQLYLPDDLYELVKARGLAASELLQNAVRAEVRRLDLLARTDEYVAKLIAEVGPPSARDRERAVSVARRLERRSTRRAG